MQIIGRVFCKKINAQKRHKKEARPGWADINIPLYVSMFFVIFPCLYSKMLQR